MAKTGTKVVAVIAALLLATVAMEAAAQDYKGALAKAILFFEAQRSGKLPAGKLQRVKWRADSGLQDGATAGVDLTGGYYDAGDNDIFGFPMAFSITLLAWTISDDARGFRAADQLNHARRALRWGTDFLLKAAAKDNELFVGVGDANVDHSCWQRPEDVDSAASRVFKIDASSPGTEAAAETAAALAASSIAFQSSDRAYSALLLQRAQAMFQFANTYRGGFTGNCPFYCSYSGYQDELLWAAAWLYRASPASAQKQYKDYIDSQASSTPSVNEFSWDQKWPGAATLLYSMGGFDSFKASADNFACAYLPGSPSRSVKTTPGGLIFVRGASNMAYAMAASMVMAKHADALAERGQKLWCGGSPDDILALAKRQVDYALGENPAGRSYMVGYGSNYPQHVHHRGASLPSKRLYPATIPCKGGFTTGLNSVSANPNVIVGALVGGPDDNDQFQDQRSNYAQLEPTTYMNAAFVGILARFNIPNATPAAAVFSADTASSDDVSWVFEEGQAEDDEIEKKVSNAVVADYSEPHSNTRHDPPPIPILNSHPVATATTTATLDDDDDLDIYP